jgi:hypothetical protein
MPKMAEQMSRGRQHRNDGLDGWSTVGESSSQRNKEKVGDLTKFGTATNRSKIVNLAPEGILGNLSGETKGWSKSDLSKTNSTTNIYSALTSESSEGRKSSEPISSGTSKPSPPTERKKLILAPRTRGITPEEPAKVASKSTSEAASSTPEELAKRINNNIENTMEEYFSIWDNLVRAINFCKTLYCN